MVQVPCRKFSQSCNCFANNQLLVGEPGDQKIVLTKVVKAHHAGA